jgi:hypothetical protein
LLATNTIAQGDTREVGLDQMTARGVTILRAIPSRKWPGEASLEVAHVWFRKGEWKGPFLLDDSPVRGITSQLQPPGRMTGKPFRLAENAGKSFQGSIVLGMGFVLTPEEAQRLLDKDPRNRDVLFPYLNGEDLNSRWDQSPSRWVINFHDWPIEKAMEYPDCFDIVERLVKPERSRNNRRIRRERWWQFAEIAPKLYATIAGLERVLVRSRVGNLHSVVFIPTGVVCSEATVVFASAEWTMLAALQNTVHTLWTESQASTMRTDVSYTPSDCLETFPFPLDLTPLDSIGERYHTHRKDIMAARREGLTAIYNRFHSPHEVSSDITTLRKLHVEMDHAVAAAYGWTDLELGHGFRETKQGMRYTISEPARREVLDRLLELNHQRHAAEAAAVSPVKPKRAARKRGSGAAALPLLDSQRG